MNLDFGGEKCSRRPFCSWPTCSPLRCPQPLPMKPHGLSPASWEFPFLLWGPAFSPGFRRRGRKVSASRGFPSHCEELSVSLILPVSHLTSPHPLPPNNTNLPQNLGVQNLTCLWKKGEKILRAQYRWLLFFFLLDNSTAVKIDIIYKLTAQ